MCTPQKKDLHVLLADHDNVPYGPLGVSGRLLFGLGSIPATVTLLTANMGHIIQMTRPHSIPL